MHCGQRSAYPTHLQGMEARETSSDKLLCTEVCKRGSTGQRKAERKDILHRGTTTHTEAGGWESMPQGEIHWL